jgi:ADP-heptose:LPS heptosyltransferase
LRIDLVLGHLLIFALRPLALILGTLLRPDHGLHVDRHLVILKMLGGGSLIMALPALLALRQKFPSATMTLVCGEGVKGYAELMHIFDDIVLVRTRSLRQLVTSAASALSRTWRADCIVDLEVHSKLSTVVCLLTCARNRVGFFMEQNRWQLGLGTHFLFFNITSRIATGYNQVAALFDARIDLASTVAWFRSKNHLEWQHPRFRFARLVAVAPFCSELGSEREYTAHEWAQLLSAPNELARATLLILGDPSRQSEGAELERALAAKLDSCEIVNLVGKTTLKEAVAVLASVDELYTIDSGLNHLARLCGPKITSFWGPTDPATRLLPIPGLDETTLYRKIFCSPCVHHIGSAPCLGNNICMKQHLGAVDIADHEASGWLIDRDTPFL